MSTPNPLCLIDMTGHSEEYPASLLSDAYLNALRASGKEIVVLDFQLSPNTLTPDLLQKFSDIKLFLDAYLSTRPEESEMPREEFPYEILCKNVHFSGTTHPGDGDLLVRTLMKDTKYYFLKFNSPQEQTDFYISYEMLDNPENYKFDESVGYEKEFRRLEMLTADTLAGGLLYPYVSFDIKAVLLWKDSQGDTYYTPVSNVSTRPFSGDNGSVQTDFETPTGEAVVYVDCFDGAYLDDSTVMASEKFNTLEELYEAHPDYFESPNTGLSATKKHFIRIS